MDNLQNALNDYYRLVGDLVLLADVCILSEDNRAKLKEIAEKLDAVQARVDSMAK